MRYDLNPIPSVDSADSVVVVDLAGLHLDPGEFVTKAANAPAVKLPWTVSSRVVQLWRTLPYSEQARCHMPPFGLRFYSKRTIICQASICWQCNNIYGQTADGDFCYEFDASRELLSILKNAVGHPAAT